MEGWEDKQFWITNKPLNNDMKWKILFWKEFLCRMKICSKAVHGEKWGACNIFGVFVCAEGEKVKVHMTYIWDDQVMRWNSKLDVIEILSFSIYHLNPLGKFCLWMNPFGIYSMSNISANDFHAAVVSSIFIYWTQWSSVCEDEWMRCLPISFLFISGIHV